MEKAWIWFDTPAGCGVGCLTVVLTATVLVGVRLLGGSETVCLAAAAVPAVGLSLLAFRVDRRRRAKPTR